jgi:hypothetical protein
MQSLSDLILSAQGKPKFPSFPSAMQWNSYSSVSQMISCGFDKYLHLELNNRVNIYVGGNNADEEESIEHAQAAPLKLVYFYDLNSDGSYNPPDELELPIVLGNLRETLRLPIPGTGDKLIANITIFMSKEGSYLLREYQKLKSGGGASYNEIVLFIELPAGDTISGNQLLVLAGKGVVEKTSMYLNSPFFRELYNENTRRELKQDQISHLLNQISSPEDTWVSYLSGFYETLETLKYKVYEWSFSTLSWAVEYLSQEVLQLRISEKYWNERHKDYVFSGVEKIIEDLLSKAIITYNDLVINAAEYLPQIATKYLNMLGEFIAKVSLAIKEFIKDGISFVIGLWNGLIDLIHGILWLIALIFKGKASEAEMRSESEYYFALVSEYLDEFFQATARVNFNQLIFTMRVYGIMFMYYFAEAIRKASKKTTALSSSEIHYYIGYILFNILEFIIPVLKGAKLSKLSKSERAFHTSGVASKASLSDEASNLSKILSQIENLIALFRKGTKGVLEEIQAAFMRLVKWLEDVFGVKLGIKFDTNLRYFNKWAHKFDVNFVNHLQGDVELLTFKLFNKKWLKYEEWIYVGGNGQGGHWLNSFLKVKKITHPPGTKSIASLADDVPFKAQIDVVSLEGKVYPKIKDSSMFPKNWDLNRISNEVARVYENTVAKGLPAFDSTGKFTKYRFFTSDGKFKILIEVDDLGNIMNAYPHI